MRLLPRSLFGVAIAAVFAVAAPAAALAISASETFDSGAGGWVAQQNPFDIPPIAAGRLPRDRR